MVSIRAYRNTSPLISNRYRVRALPDFGFNIKEIIKNIVSVEGIAFPSLESNPVQGASTNTYFPGMDDIAGFTIAFLLTREIGDETLDYLNHWKGLIVGPGGTRNYPNKYKRDITIDLIGKNDDVITSIKYGGCFPTNISALSLASDNADAVRAEQEFSVDTFTKI